MGNPGSESDFGKVRWITSLFNEQRSELLAISCSRQQVGTAKVQVLNLSPERLI